MDSYYKIKPIAYIRTDFPEKFGIPRQSGLVSTLKAKIFFEPEFASPDAVKGLDGFSHIWLIWGFSETMGQKWTPTVRPPRLGGNLRVGVFATRSPFRPNSLGLSCVRLEAIETDRDHGLLLCVAGADLLDRTPIFDIKPYLPYVDSFPEAAEGFGGDVKEYALIVNCPEEYLNLIPQSQRTPLLEILAQDPRPSYHNDPNRIYGMKYAGMEVKFFVNKNVLSVCKIETL